MMLKAYNRSLINDNEKTYLTVAAAATDTSITVANTDLAPAGSSSNTWSDNDYMIIGEIGAEGTEVMQVAGAVSSATAITIDREGQTGGCRLAHPIGTPVYKIGFNQVMFYNNSTNTTTGATALNSGTAINIQPDDEFTRYEDNTNTTGYGFIRFKNATTGGFSSYSDGVNYEEGEESSSRDPKTLWSLRKKVRKQLDEDKPNSKLTDEMIDEALNDKQREIAHQRLWTFYEGEKSLSLVANQFAYDIPATVQMIHGVKVDTKPLVFCNKNNWDLQHINTSDTSTDLSSYTIWNRQLWFNPRPSTASSTTTLGAELTAGATSATVADSTGFNRGDYFRFVIESEVIYATGSTSTTFTGLLRGQEGTTDATHANGSTLTERDIVYSCHLEPEDLIDTQDRTYIPEPDVLVFGAAADLAPFVGKKDMIALFEAKYNKRIKDLQEKYSSKQTSQFGRVKDMSERNIGSPYLNSNLYPRDVNT